MIELTFLTELIIKEVHQKNAKLITVVFFLDKEFQFQPYVCNGSHDVLMMSKNLSDILNINGLDYCRIIAELVKGKL